MPKFGETALDVDVFLIPLYHYETPDADVGETVSTYSSSGIGQASIETKAPAVAKAGETVVEYDMGLIMILFGELE